MSTPTNMPTAEEPTYLHTAAEDHSRLLAIINALPQEFLSALRTEVGLTSYHLGQSITRHQAINIITNDLSKALKAVTDGLNRCLEGTKEDHIQLRRVCPWLSSFYRMIPLPNHLYQTMLLPRFLHDASQLACQIHVDLHCFCLVYPGGRTPSRSLSRTPSCPTTPLANTSRPPTPITTIIRPKRPREQPEQDPEEPKTPSNRRDS